jgi:hypothetical protein
MVMSATSFVWSARTSSGRGAADGSSGAAEAAIARGFYCARAPGRL